jgi:hypothetical protein
MRKSGMGLIAETASVWILIQITVSVVPNARAGDLCITIEPTAESIELFREPTDDSPFDRIRKSVLPKEVCLLATRSGRFRIKWEERADPWVPSHQFAGEFRPNAPFIEPAGGNAAGVRLGAGVGDTAGVTSPAPAYSAPAALNECQRLWIQRNQMYKNYGYCFQTPDGINYFGNIGCTNNDQNLVYRRFPPSAQSFIRDIQNREETLRCRIGQTFQPPQRPR